MNPQDDYVASRDPFALALARIALQAGPVVMEEYARAADARTKSDGSPVTAADERAEALIRASLERLAPDIPIIAEEAVAAGGSIPVANCFFLVDPLDGTKEFINRLDRQRCANRGRRIRPRDRETLVRGRQGPCLQSRSRPTLAGTKRVARDPHTRRAQGPDRPRKSLSHRRPDGILPGDSSDRRASRGGVVAQVLCGGRGRSGCLPPIWTDHGMGYGGRRRRPSRRRRRCAARRRTDARLWKARPGIAERRLRGLGRPAIRPGVDSSLIFPKGRPQ